MSADDPQRGTGRTTRMILQAAEHTNAGYRVLIWAAHERHAGQLRQLFIGAGGNPNLVMVRSQDNHGRPFGGYLSDVEVWDHYALEVHAGRADRCPGCRP